MATVFGGTLNVRAEKSTGSSLIGTLPNGTVVDVVRCDATWATLVHNGTPAFVQHQFLSGCPTTIGDYLAATSNALVNGNNVNVRTGPGTSYSTTGAQLSKGNALTTGQKSLAADGYWYKIDASAQRWVRGDFLAPGGSGGGSGGVTYYTSNTYLTTAQMQVNAQYILDYLRPRGWTKNAVCGMLGNMQVESTINPGIWQSLNANNPGGGYGLVQWTPSTKFTNWASQNGYAINNMDSQLQRIIYEVPATGSDAQWFATTAYNLTFAQFKISTNTADYLGRAFLRNYERPANPNETQRGNNSTAWYNLLI